jgi:hypothetical protein
MMSALNERIAEGVAKASGVRFGRKKKLTATELDNLR